MVSAANPPSSPETRDWYSISFDSLRVVLGALVLLVCLGLVAWGGISFQGHRQEQRAAELIANARSLVGQLRNNQEVERHQESFDRGASLLAEAEASLESGDYSRATDVGEESFQLLSDILDRLVNDGEGGIAWFVNVEGDVQYRRGESGRWIRAVARDFVYDGYYVRSASNASAELYFHYDETRFTIRPGTFFKVSSREALEQGNLGFMEYGYVDLDTSQTSSGVSTRYSEITVASNTRASVDVNKSGESRIVVETGEAAVRSGDGTTRRVGERQQLEGRGSSLGDVKTLPGAPALAAPPDNFNIDIDVTRRVTLEWQPAPDAVTYALQVSRSRLFGESVIDAQNRPETTATLGLRAIGSYVWRVAAIDAKGARGPWSEPRKFRVESFRGLALDRDDTPPPLDVNVLMNGRIAILRGETEPGARVELDGRPVRVGADGSIQTSETLAGSGRTIIRLRAIDQAGNAQEVKKIVFLPE